MNEAWAKAAEAKGHTLKLDPVDGDIDWFVVDSDYHNGPECITCGESWCHHCTSSENIEPCDGGAAEQAAFEERCEAHQAAIKTLSDRLNVTPESLVEALAGINISHLFTPKKAD